MKIYPSPHQIKVAETPKYLDIPVAHIEHEYYPQKIMSILNPDFALEEKEFVAPYQRFETDNILFFDNSENVINPNIKLEGYSYYYEPTNAQEFSPEEFKVWALIKRNDWMDSSKKYNLRVGVYKQSNSRDFAKELISIFGDAPYRQISPANVEVNNGSLSVDDLLVGGGDGYDWLFVETHDAVIYKEQSQNIDFDTLMRNNANLWLTVEDGGAAGIFDMVSANNKYTTYLINFDGEKVIPSEESIEIGEEYGYSAKTDTTIQSMPNTEYRYILPEISSSSKTKFPIYIIEKPDKGYIVVSSKRMFDHLDKYSKYIYQVMLQIYFKSYVRTPQKNLWITNKPVDYMGSLKSPFRRTHPEVNLDKMVMQANNNIVDYTLESIMFDVDDVLYVNTDSNGNMNFKKVSITDPSIPGDSVSVYTTKKTVAVYKDTPIRLIESSIAITPEITDDGDCYIIVGSFKSSKHRLLSSGNKRFKIKNITESYILYALPTDGTEDSFVDLILAKEYNPASSVELARVSVQLIGKASSYDVRLLGGGLPEEYTDYEMLDIGNLEGRPYRVGTGAIVCMPNTLEKYDNLIKETIDKHKVAGDKIYTLYSKPEED